MGFLATFGMRLAHHLADRLFPEPPNAALQVLQAVLPAFLSVYAQKREPGTSPLITPPPFGVTSRHPDAYTAPEMIGDPSIAAQRQWTAGFGGSLGEAIDRMQGTVPDRFVGGGPLAVEVAQLNERLKALEGILYIPKAPPPDNAAPKA